VRKTTIQSAKMLANIGIEEDIFVTEVQQYSYKDSIDVAPYENDHFSSHNVAESNEFLQSIQAEIN
jgi:hypothetical protein